MKKSIYFDQNAEKEISKFEKVVQIKLNVILRVLEQDGKISEPDGKRIDKDIFEIRIRHKGQFRIFYAYIGTNDIVVLSAFQKKTQKTPLNEIKKATKRLMLYT